MTDEKKAIIAEIATEFNNWFNDTVVQRSDVPLEVIPEIMSLLYCRLRIWFEREAAINLMTAVADHIEHLIDEKQLFIGMDGEMMHFRAAEDFESDEDRQFWIDASHGITDDDITQLLG